jgi:predicted nucleic-acid-binding protein
MKAVDTNILARFFIDDPDDEQAALQRPIATAILSQAIYIPMTVILEFEWVMRGFYKLNRSEILHVYQVLLSLGLTRLSLICSHFNRF